MADYNSLKVPELKKLLTERGLPHTGNKADLIARLVENDKQKAAEAAPKGMLFAHHHRDVAPSNAARCCAAIGDGP